MRKIICVLVVSIMILCSCGSPEIVEPQNDMVEINYDKISRRNNRTVLINKYDSISETTQYFNLKNPGTISDWTIKYSLNGNTQPNVMFTFGDEAECYYNGVIYKSSKEGFTCTVPVKSDYESMLKEVLKRDNTLNYVYYNQKEGFKTTKGYAASYWFTITHDVLDEFIYWNVEIGDTIKVDYNLNKNFEIIDCTYYIVSGPYTSNTSYTKILSSKTSFNSVYKFPAEIYNFDANKTTLTITENFQKQSQTIEEFTVPIGITIDNNEFFSEVRAFTSPGFEKEWNFEEDLITKDLELFIYSKDSPELEEYDELKESEE